MTFDNGNSPIAMLRVFYPFCGVKSRTLAEASSKKLKAFEIGIPWTERITNTEVLIKMGKETEVLNTVETRKLQYLGHIMRNESKYVLLQKILQGRYVELEDWAEGDYRGAHQSTVTVLQVQRPLAGQGYYLSTRTVHGSQYESSCPDDWTRIRPVLPAVPKHLKLPLRRNKINLRSEEKRSRKFILLVFISSNAFPKDNNKSTGESNDALNSILFFSFLVTIKSINQHILAPVAALGVGEVGRMPKQNLSDPTIRPTTFKAI
ncbi:hypothetical protein HUJ05_003545 [Dendroctonus ponderosae]|nr:hypothetical protein HUJ05_003545 [Dendroctonus ponderosae]